MAEKEDKPKPDPFADVLAQFCADHPVVASLQRDMDEQLVKALDE